jgi:hypothetical protein
LANYEGSDWLKANNSAYAVVFLKLSGNIVMTPASTGLCFLQANPSNFPDDRFVQNQGIFLLHQAGRRPHVDFDAWFGLSWVQFSARKLLPAVDPDIPLFPFLGPGDRQRWQIAKN